MGKSALWRVSLALASLVVALGIPTASAHAEDASLSGTISAGDTGGPLSACVDAYSADTFDFVATGCADETGLWQIAGLQSGSAYLLVAYGASGYASQVAIGKHHFSDADPITAPATVDFVLEPSGTLTGTLLRSDGSPDSGGQVIVHPADDITTSVADFGTDSDGHWSGEVPQGTYKVEFSDFPATVWAHGQLDGAHADLITIGAHETVSLDEQFPAPGALRGTVIETDSGEPLANICMRLHSAVDDSNPVDDVCTNAAGRYRVEMVPPGTYKLEFTDPASVHVTKWYKSSLTQAEATPVSVAPGQVVTGLNVKIPIGASIVGRIVDAISGRPLPDVCVGAQRVTSFDTIAFACSDTGGRYKLTGMPASRIILRSFGDSTHPRAFAPGVATPEQATKYRIALGETTNAGQFMMPRGGTLAGHVSNQQGEPLADVWVSIPGVSLRAGPGENPDEVQTDANGDYVISNATPGSWTPSAFDPNRVYGWQWSGHASDTTTATPVQVISEQTTTLNFVLDPGANIEGTLINSDGSSATDFVGSDVAVYTAGGRFLVGGGSASQDGPDVTLRLGGGLPAGPVLLVATLNIGEPNQREAWYNAAISADAATPISLTAGATSTITFTMP